MPFTAILDRNGDLLLDFFGGAAGPLRDDLDVVVGYVGIRFHRQIVERDHAPDHQQDGRRQNQEAVVQGEIDERANHVDLPVRRVLKQQRIGDHAVAGPDAR